MAKLRIVVNFRFEGIHSWPQAPQDCSEYHLKNDHRHIFHVEAVKDVEHAERHIEIIDFKRKLEMFCADNLCGPHTHSCEAMAHILLEQFKLHRCTVLEDGENGAEVEA